jgi:amino acid transporter
MFSSPSLFLTTSELFLLSTSDVAVSLFVIAIGYPEIKVLPDIINVVFLIYLCCIGSESIFYCLMGSIRHGEDGHVPGL